MTDELQPDPRDEFDLRKARERYDAFVERALEHHARTGEWPPDPLLDEVAEMRRSVLAEHGNDYHKLWEWYVELDRQAAEQEAGARLDGKQERPAA
ncbi:MAG TPA: hypothetical protein VF006_20170 [Longimicrobium sp.]